MMDNKYLIAFDMDGTLLEDTRKAILPKTKQYLIELTNQGHKIILASGRPESELQPYYDELGLSTPLVCFNGISCFNPKDKNFKELSNTLPKENAIYLTEKLIGKTWDNAFAENNDEIWMIKKDDDLIKVMWPHGIQRTLHIGDFKDTLTKDPMTLIFYKKNPHGQDELIKKEVLNFKNANLRFWYNNTFVEVYFGHVSKAAPLEYIRQYYGFDKEHTICFGDYTNDIEMIKWAGHGVAMKNGVEELKKVANYITVEDNNNEGIVATLKMIIESDK